MNMLSLFPLIPLVMMLGLWLSKSTRQIHAVMATGSAALLVLAVVLVVRFLGLREAGETAAMLFTDSHVWYAPLNIHYAVGVDGISVAMLLLSAIIVFTGTFASWRMQEQVKEYFLWFSLLSVGVFGFFISVDLFTMFLFYEVALIPMYLLIGVWGSGRKEYAAMKLTLMLMGGSALLLIGILGIYFGSGATTMNVLEIAQLHNIPVAQQRSQPTGALSVDGLKVADVHTLRSAGRVYHIVPRAMTCLVLRKLASQPFVIAKVELHKTDTLVRQITATTRRTDSRPDLGSPFKGQFHYEAAYKAARTRDQYFSAMQTHCPESFQLVPAKIRLFRQSRARRPRILWPLLFRFGLFEFHSFPALCFGQKLLGNFHRRIEPLLLPAFQLANNVAVACSQLAESLVVGRLKPAYALAHLGEVAGKPDKLIVQFLSRLVDFPDALRL